MDFAKIDLHLHLDGSLPPATILRLAREQNLALPAGGEDALVRSCAVGADCHSLRQYLTCFRLPLRLLQTAQSLRSATADLLAALAAEGLEYVEIRFAPQLHGQAGLTQAGAVEAVLAAVQGQTALRAGVILCMMTTGSTAQNAQTAALAIQYRPLGVCGLDLAGQEGACAPEATAPFFAQAVENGVGITIHAGEACGAQSVAAALALGTKRIGHGTHAILEDAVLRRVIDGGVTLEQCVTSNVQTGCARSYEAHPIRRLFDAGVRIAVCTDNRTVSGTTLAREYEILQRVLGFTDAECAILAAFSRRAAFL